MSWQVRAARREDAQAIWDLTVELAIFEKLEDKLTGSPDRVAKWLFDEPVASALVAEDEGQVVGYALYFPTLATFRMTPGLWLEDLYVKNDHRGRGIGKALISQVIEVARENRYARVDWSVLGWNTGAIEFYNSLGAEILPEWHICRFNL